MESKEHPKDPSFKRGSRQIEPRTGGPRIFGPQGPIVLPEKVDSWALVPNYLVHDCPGRGPICEEPAVGFLANWASGALLSGAQLSGPNLSRTRSHC